MAISWWVVIDAGLAAFVFRRSRSIWPVPRININESLYNNIIFPLRPVICKSQMKKEDFEHISLQVLEMKESWNKSIINGDIVMKAKSQTLQTKGKHQRAPITSGSAGLIQST